MAALNSNVFQLCVMNSSQCEQQEPCNVSYEYAGSDNVRWIDHWPASRDQIFVGHGAVGGRQGGALLADHSRGGCGLQPSDRRQGERTDSASMASAARYLFQVASIVSSRCSQASTLGISRLNSTIRV